MTRLKPCSLARKVPMPRFRKPQSPSINLTEAVRKVLMHATRHQKNVAAFVISGRLVLASAGTVRCKQLETRWPEQMVGIYGSSLKIQHLVDDLREHFTDEVGA